MAIAYTSYKKFGSDWLPELPSHWARQRIKFLTTFMVSGGTPPTGSDHYWGGDIPWVSPKDMKAPAIFETEDYITGEGLRRSAARLVPANTLLMVVRSGILRHSIPVALSAREVTINQDIKAVGFLSGTSPAYVRYFIEGLQAELLARWSKVGTTVESIESEYFANDEIPVPPLSEQIAIVSFLDREILRIDALIEKKRRLLELLEEQRLAVITHAVTKGLNPNVSMKDSGVDWLGDIPAHWMPIRIANLTNQITNGYVGPTREILVDAGIRYIQSLHIKSGKILFNRGHYFVEEEWSLAHAKSILRRGDVLVVQTGEIGQTALVGDEYEGCNCHALIIMRPRVDRLRGAFLELYLRSDVGQKYLASIQTGALHPHLNCTIIRDVYVPTPPTLDEQDAIIAHIESMCEPIDRAREYNERSVALLSEYRSALITNAVTGKIDVRGEMEKEVAA